MIEFSVVLARPEGLLRCRRCAARCEPATTWFEVRSLDPIFTLEAIKLNATKILAINCLGNAENGYFFTVLKVAS